MAEFSQAKKRRVMELDETSNKILINHETILGSGAHSVIFLGRFETRLVAVKRIYVLNLSNNREEDVLQKLNHENIIKFYHAEYQNDNQFRCYALELCAASMDKLFLHDDDVKKYRGPRPSKEDGLLQMADGLHYLHSKRFIHREIKPQNVLISATSPVLLKWTGFGYVKEVSARGSHSFRSGVHAQFEWTAPEILKLIGDPSESNKRGTIKSDIFSAGLVFFCWLTDGVHPFGDSSVINGYHIITNNLVNFSKLDAVVAPTHYVYKMLKDGMMNPDHDLRMSMNEIKEIVMEFHGSSKTNEGSL